MNGCVRSWLSCTLISRVAFVDTRQGRCPLAGSSALVAAINHKYRTCLIGSRCRHNQEGDSLVWRELRLTNGITPWQPSATV